MQIVTADIGGTHARFALAEIADGEVTALGEPVIFGTSEYPTFDEAWAALRDHLGALPDRAAFGLACPVTGGPAKLTNNDWVIDPARLHEDFGLSGFVMLNDFAAIAHAVAKAGDAHLEHLFGPDRPLPRGVPTAVIGPGTGLGVAQLILQDDGHFVIPTEASHIGFAPVDALDDRILAHLREKWGRVSVERIVAGPALRDLYEALAEIDGERPEIAEDRVLWASALDGSDPRAVAAFERFCLSFGAFAGDMVLAQGARAVVLAGGLGQRMAPALSKSGFYDRFLDKGRFSEIVENAPIKLITHPQPGLYGAAVAFAQAQRDGSIAN